MSEQNSSGSSGGGGSSGGSRPSGFSAALRWSRGVLLAFGFTLLLGGHCRRHHHDDDDYCGNDDDFFDDDDFDSNDCHDDDDVIIIIAGEEDAQDPWLLQSYELEVDPEGVRHYRDIRGMSLFAALGAGDYGPSDFAGFAAQIWERNRDLLGPALGDGFSEPRVEKAGVQSAGDRLIIQLRVVPGQRPVVPGDDESDRLPERPSDLGDEDPSSAPELNYWFDLSGRLVELSDASLR